MKAIILLFYIVVFIWLNISFKGEEVVEVAIYEPSPEIKRYELV